MGLMLVVLLVLGVATQQLPPPNLLNNGDARGGASAWRRGPGYNRIADVMKDAAVETREGVSHFALRNGASFTQHVYIRDDEAGKFLLIIARASSERVYDDNNITGLPYLWARLMSDAKPSNATILQGMSLKTKRADEWGTIQGIFPVPEGVRGITLMLGQGERRGTPQNGSAARITNVEMRLFDTRALAEAYAAIYTASQ